MSRKLICSQDDESAFSLLARVLARRSGAGKISFWDKVEESLLEICKRAGSDERRDFQRPSSHDLLPLFPPCRVSGLRRRPHSVFSQFFIRMRTIQKCALAHSSVDIRRRCERSELGRMFPSKVWQMGGKPGLLSIFSRFQYIAGSSRHCVAFSTNFKQDELCQHIVARNGRLQVVVVALAVVPQPYVMLL